MKIDIDDKGNLKLNVYDLLEQLDDEEKNRIVEGFAWDSPMFEEIKRGVNEDCVGENYNPDIYKLRLAFLQGEDIDKNIKDLIHELLSINKRLNKQLNDWRDTYYQWYRWHSDQNRNRSEYVPTPVDSPKYEYVTSTNTELDAVLKALGITQEMMADPTNARVQP